MLSGEIVGLIFGIGLVAVVLVLGLSLRMSRNRYGCLVYMLAAGLIGAFVLLATQGWAAMQQSIEQTDWVRTDGVVQEHITWDPPMGGSKQERTVIVYPGGDERATGLIGQVGDTVDVWYDPNWPGRSTVRNPTEQRVEVVLWYLFAGSTLIIGYRLLRTLQRQRPHRT